MEPPKTFHPPRTFHLPRALHLTWPSPPTTRIIRRVLPTIRSCRSRRQDCDDWHSIEQSSTWILSHLVTRLNGLIQQRHVPLQFQPNTLKTTLLYLRHNHEQPSLATKSDDLQDIIKLMDPAGASQSTWGSLTTAETRSWPR